MISTTEALTGPWAANVRGALLTAVPLSLVVVLQELFGGALGPAAIVASVVLQFIASLAWSAVVAAVSRRVSGRVGLAALPILWTGFGVVRGVVGAAIAHAAGAEPDWVYRIAFWVAVSVIWLPLINFALAQLDSRRRLMARRAVTGTALAAAVVRATENADDRARRLARAVDDSLRPALEEIRDALRSSALAIDERTLDGLARRVEHLAERTSSFSTPSATPAIPRFDEPMSVQAAVQEFELRRPVVAALITGVATAAVLYPEALREGGWPHVAEAAVAIVVAVALMYGTILVLQRRGTRLRPAVRRVSIIVGALAGAGMLGVLPWEPFESRDVLVIATFPLLFATAASIVSIAAALARTNAHLGRLALEERETLAGLRARARAADEATSAGIVKLVRGEVNGRLASCAMALGFLASGGIPADSRAAAIEAVIAQLDDVDAELAQIVPK